MEAISSSLVFPAALSSEPVLAGPTKGHSTNENCPVDIENKGNGFGHWQWIILSTREETALSLFLALPGVLRVEAFH